jgi:predicted transcriptional regulator of viral defense system
VYKLLNDNDGYLTTKMAREHGVNASTLKRMADYGLIERAAHGLYVSIDTIPDPFFIAHYRCPQGVFSHETALFFNDLSDRTPFRLMMTIPSGWNTRLISSDDMMIFYSDPKYAKLGVIETKTPFGKSVSVYQAPRTICDCLQSIEKLDKDLVLTALKRYLKDPSGDKAMLLEFAAIFKIRDIVIRYMEVLS